jgi:hypothetical protein
MKKLFLLAILLLAAPAQASETYLFTLTSASPTAATNNNTTELLSEGGQYAIQCDGAARVRASAGGDAATANSVLVEANRLFDLPLFSREKRISVLAVAGTVNCRVYAVKKVR